MRTPRAVLVAVLAATAAVTGGLAVAQPVPTSVPAPARAVSYADWATYHGSNYRAGYAPTMPAASGTPRVLAKLKLDGQVYASPIVVGGVTIVATENNTVYAFDAAMRQLWRTHIGPPSPAAQRPCGNIDPLGITGTPVYSPADRAVYVAPEFGTSPLRHELWALSATTGRPVSHRSLDLPGVDTTVMQQRGALSLFGSRVYVPFGGLSGDCGAYKGRVVAYPTSLVGAPNVFTVPTTREAGIWTPPGATIDSAGHLLVAVGNGESGVGDTYDYSDSILQLTPTLKYAQVFSPTTWPTDNDADLDLGSQGPTIVGDFVFSAGKSGTAYVLRRSELGGIGGQVSTANICKSFGGTAVYRDIVIVPCTDGLRGVRVDTAGTMHVLWHTGSAVTGSPVIGGGYVWSLDPRNGELYSLGITTGAVRQHLTVGVTTRFATPALYGRNVTVPTTTGITVVATS